MFQQTVRDDLGVGVIGELAFDSAIRATPAVLNSPDAANNVIGRAFTYLTNAAGAVEPNPVRAGGTGVFAGILGSPKAYANYGTAAGGSLASNMTLPNTTIVELFEETAGIFVEIAAATIGNLVIYNTTTGALANLAAGQPLPGGFAIVPNAVVARYTNGSETDDIAVIALNGPMPVGAPDDGGV